MREVFKDLRFEQQITSYQDLTRITHDHNRNKQILDKLTLAFKYAVAFQKGGEALYQLVLDCMDKNGYIPYDS